MEQQIRRLEKNWKVLLGITKHLSERTYVESFSSISNFVETDPEKAKKQVETLEKKLSEVKMVKSKLNSLRPHVKSELNLLPDDSLTPEVKSALNSLPNQIERLVLLKKIAKKNSIKKKKRASVGVDEPKKDRTSKTNSTTSRWAETIKKQIFGAPKRNKTAKK